MASTRRQFLKGTLAAGAGVMLAPGLSWGQRAAAVPAAAGLSDPALQPKFVNSVPNAADPAFSYKGKKNKYNIDIGATIQQTGLVDANGYPLSTPVFGYGEKGVYTWPGKTIFAKTGEPVQVKWRNKLLDPLTDEPLSHILPVDTSLHWAYALHGYEQYSIENDGIPVVAHLHGGHTDFQYDGNPEFFFSPGYGVRGPQWVEKNYIYAPGAGIQIRSASPRSRAAGPRS